MTDSLTLYMLLLGCRPEGRFTEQHDIFFGVGRNMADLKPALRGYWPQAPVLHIDAWREVNSVDGNRISVAHRVPGEPGGKARQLFFINLGGYKENEFDEFHYKLLTVGASTSEAITAAKATAFYRHTGFTGAVSHVDDKYGVDIDDILNIEDILSHQYKDRYTLRITPDSTLPEDVLHLGYLNWDRL